MFRSTSCKMMMKGTAQANCLGSEPSPSPSHYRIKNITILLRNVAGKVFSENTCIVFLPFWIKTLYNSEVVTNCRRPYRKFVISPKLATFNESGSSRVFWLTSYNRIVPVEARVLNFNFMQRACSLKLKIICEMFEFRKKLNFQFR